MPFSSSFVYLLSCILLASTVHANLECTASSFSSIFPSNTTVVTAAPVTKFGTFHGDGFNVSFSSNITNDALPICLVELNVKSSANTSFNTGILLPNNWNGRMLGTGNPGFGGGLRWSFQANILKYGPAVSVSTDTGHVGPPNNIDFAINNPDGIIDWAYRSLHESTVLAKQASKAFYGSDVQHSYYTACSNGGRQGLKEVQMFPEDYDGVLAGAPPWQINHIHPWALQLGLWNLPNTSATHIPPWKFPIVEKLVMDQCDAQDGLADGIIQEPYSCNFSSSEIMCNSTDKPNTCLTSGEIETLSLFYNDWKAADGTMLNSRFPLSASASRYAGVTDAPNHFGLEYLYGFVFNNTNWDWTTWKGEESLKYVDSIDSGHAGALSMDISAFKANGGKLLMYHGLADTTIPTGSSIEYFQGVNTTTGAVDDFFQLYLVPGMGHCGESEVAPYYIAAAGQVVNTASGGFGFSVPGYEDPEHDVLMAMMRWVENGTAPDHIIATKFVNDTVENGISMQRPLCPFPQKAVYGGASSGDWHNATAWSCQSGEVMKFPNVNGSVGSVAMIQNTTNSKATKHNGVGSVVMMGEAMSKVAIWGFLAAVGLGVFF